MPEPIMTAIEPVELNDAIMPEEERKIVNEVVSMFKHSKKEKDKYTAKWDKIDRYLSGEQWDKPRPSWKADIVVNWIKTVIEDFLPIMTDNSPRILVQSKEGLNNQMSEIKGLLIDQIWTDNKMSLKTNAYCKNALQYGNGFSKVLWDSARDMVKIINIDPRNIFPDPGAIDDPDTLEWLIYATYRNINYIKQNYPERGELVKPGKWGGLGEDIRLKKTYPGIGSQQVTSPVTTTDNKSQYFYSDRVDYGGDTGEYKDMCLVLEGWWNPNNQYPDGRRVTIANGVLLIDSPNPFSHKKIPFVKLDDMINTSSYWSEGEVEQLMKPSVGFNKLLCQLIDILNYTANPLLILEGNLVANAKREVTNRPGNIINLEGGAKAYFLTSPPPTSMIIEAMNILKDAINNISGKQDALIGRRPSSIVAGKAIEALQEAAQSRLRLKIRNLESALEEIGRMALSLIKQFYTEPLKIKRKNPLTGKDELIFINETGENGQIINNLQDESEDETVTILSGSTMPKHKAARFEQAIELNGLGLIDREEVLKSADWPNWEEVDQRMAKKEQLELNAPKTNQNEVIEEGGE